MAPRKIFESEPNLAEAAEKARLLIRDLQARLQAHAPQKAGKGAEETPEELEKQLANYFSGSSPPPQAVPLDEIRNRVIDAVADRLLRQWEQGSALENAVIERLIDRLLSRLQ